MGQIIGSAAKPKRCNLNQLSQLGVPAAGEHILVSSDNSMNAAGQGNFDCYIEGDGQKAAKVLELNHINEFEHNMAEIVSATSATTRNLYDGKDLKFTHFYTLGEVGVTMLEAGTYTLSANVTCANSRLKVLVYGSSGLITYLYLTSGGRSSITVTSTTTIERFLIYAGASASAAQRVEATLSDIQIEANSSPTEFVEHYTMVDSIARDNIDEVEKSIDTINLAIGTTRNLYDGGDLNFTTYYTIGEVGVTLLPAGTYTLSADVICDSSRLRIFIYLSTGVFGDALYLTSGGRSSVTFTSSDVIERIVIYAAESASQATDVIATLNNIQIEAGSSATNYVEHYTAIDSVARENIEDVRQEISENTGSEYPNLLQNIATTQTVRGVTFQVNNDGSISAYGSSTSNSIILINTITLGKGAYWLGTTNQASTKSCLRIIRGDGTYSDTYLNENLPVMRFEVVNDSEEVSVYAVVKDSHTEDNPFMFYPIIQKIGVPWRGYIQYGKAVNYGNFLDNVLHSPYNNIWKGKKLCVLGDSIAAGSNLYGRWSDMVAQALGVSDVLNLAVGGSRMSYYGDGGSVTADQSVVALYSSVPSDADIIYIHAGTNDWASQVELGDEDSTDNLTFNGALNIIMSGLRASHPTALIIFDTILPRLDYDAPTHSGNTMSILTSSYSAAIKSRCKANHIVCFDIYEECGFDFEYDYNNSIYATTNDGLHPNYKGNQIMARKIIGFINCH